MLAYMGVSLLKGNVLEVGAYYAVLEGVELLQECVVFVFLVVEVFVDSMCVVCCGGGDVPHVVLHVVERGLAIIVILVDVSPADLELVIIVDPVGGEQ